MPRGRAEFGERLRRPGVAEGQRGREREPFPTDAARARSALDQGVDQGHLQPALEGRPARDQQAQGRTARSTVGRRQEGVRVGAPPQEQARYVDRVARGPLEFVGDPVGRYVVQQRSAEVVS